MKSYIIVFLTLITGLSVAAQDTLRKREVNITSTFKPVLKEAAKINFDAAPPSADSTRPRLQYNIPNQNLQFAFQPGTLKPLALQVDTGGRWNNESYVKAGFGNLTTPFVQAGLSLGDGKTAGLNVYAKHISSKGKRDFQDYRNTNVDVAGFFQTAKNLEWTARLGSFQEKYFKYGYMPKELTFPEDSLEVKYHTWRARVGFHNINNTQFGISYAPEMKVDVFNDGLSNSESNTYIKLPVQKAVGKVFAVDVALEASLNRYKPDDKDAINNNFVAIAPSILFKTPNANIQAGIRPSWNNGDFKLFPNIMAEFGSADKSFSFQLGWVGYLRYSGYQYLAGYNPWIWTPENVYNTVIEERYAGFKGSVGDHFSYGAKLGFHKYNNQPLFLNDNVDGKSFVILNEPEMKVFHIGGEMGYNVGERFSLISNLNFNQYKTDEQDKAWGLLPMEFTTKMRIQVMKDLFITGDLYAFEGPRYKDESGDSKRLKGAVDLSGGAEFGILKNLKVWAQFNNIMNKEYQRWNRYPVYGFNFLGGIVFSFGQNNSK
jgi:hypothetical protein